MVIDSIRPKPLPPEQQVHLTKRYQRLVGLINWMATCTRPDLSPSVSFLATYNHSPTKQHLDSAMYVVRYIRNTIGYGISFSSKSTTTLKTFLHIPLPHDAEAYSDARRPYDHETHELSAFSDANWGPQDASAPDPVTPQQVHPKNMRSMSGYIIFRSGGPILWSCVRQERTARSSSEVEIKATDELVKRILALKNVM